jgi:CRISPR/Cas system-associated protein Cas10 (large subunit of type III CRISPR-Cas system)
MLVPGEKADVSCGIAIGYCKTPLQSLVKEAQSAEKKAKNEYGRASFALSLLKRGGETIHWGAKWNSHALDLYFKYRELATGKENALISNRFPYALAELLRQYNLDRRQKKLEDASEFDKREVRLRGFPERKRRLFRISPVVILTIFKQSL